jgi:hypothetical protein
MSTMIDICALRLSSEESGRALAFRNVGAARPDRDIGPLAQNEARRSEFNW